MSAIVETILPPPVIFDLDIAESARLRDALFRADGGRASLLLLAFSIVVQCVPPILRLSRHHGNGPVDWGILGVLLLLACAVVIRFVAPRLWESLLLKPEIDTTIAFEDAGIVLDRASRGGTAKRRIAFAKIRSVRLMPDAVVVMGRFAPLVIIPRRALPGDGAGVMSYFDDHLVAKGMLRRSPFGRARIVNTSSP